MPALLIARCSTAVDAQPRMSGEVNAGGVPVNSGSSRSQWAGADQFSITSATRSIADKNASRMATTPQQASGRK